VIFVSIIGNYLPCAATASNTIVVVDTTIVENNDILRNIVDWQNTTIVKHTAIEDIVVRKILVLKALLEMGATILLPPLCQRSCETH